MRSQRGRDDAAAAAVEAGGQAERNLQQERVTHREEVHMLKQAINEYKAQIQNIVSDTVLKPFSVRLLFLVSHVFICHYHA